MASLSLTGMASGLDTETIIAQLMHLEGRGRLQVLAQQKATEGRITALGDVGRQLRALNASVTDLRSALTWGDVQTATSSDASKIGARVVGSASPGSFEVAVSQLARAEQRTFDYTETTAADGSAQTQQITIDGIAVDIAAGTSLQGVVDAINGTAGMTVHAGVVNGQLTLTGKELGAAISVTSATNSVTEDVAKQVAAQMTRYTVNGVQQEDTTASVVQPGGLPGVELSLKAVTGDGPVTVSVSPPGVDADRVSAAVKAFVEAYNAAVGTVGAKLTEQTVAAPVSAADHAKGRLRGDVMLTGMLAELRRVAGPAEDATPDAIDTLAEIGVTVAASTGDKPGDDALAGKLVLDEARLADALSADPQAVENLLGGDGDGIAQRLAAVLDPIANATTGYLANASSAASNEVSRLGGRLVDIDRTLSLKEERLRGQFTALEIALNQSQSHGSWLQAQLAGLPSWS